MDSREIYRLDKVVKLVIRVCGYGCALLLAGCNVGSDENQQPGSTGGTVSSLSTQSVQVSKPGSTSSQIIQSTTDQPQSDVYTLVMHGVNSSGERIGSAVQFQKVVSPNQTSPVELIWFQPARAADGSCLHDLAGYDVVYNTVPASNDVTLPFDLASRDLTCTSVGTTECGDVRECRYNLTI